MINLSEALSYEEYLNKASEEQREAQLSAYKRTQLSEKTIETVETISKTINVVVFSESFCPDCIVMLPFIKKMQELNENIKLYIFPRSGNEEFLRECSGVSRIPTVMTFTKDMEPKGLFVEFPDDLKEKMVSLTEDEKKNLIKEYREGRYSNLIEEELLKLMK